MEIQFEGKYKSITSFKWTDIPSFVIITGINGTGKSQLLDLIYNTIINKVGTKERVSIINKDIKPDEVTFLKGEWQLQNTEVVNLSTMQRQMDELYHNFKSNNRGQMYNHDNGVRFHYASEEVMKKAGKNRNDITKEDFNKHFPEMLIEQESFISKKIGEVFYNYRLSEIEHQAKGKTEEEIKKVIGEKPWVVLREIIKESKLPFDVNDPSDNGIRDGFQLRLTHQQLKEEIIFSDLSSGEKVLISLVFYLYNSKEKQIFPKLLLLDEPDAHLHPSMSQQFINVIKNVLVDKFGVQVIMTTHSPSTVMLAPPDSIYEMSVNEPRIRKASSKNHLISLLTAGLVYVGEGTKYFLVEDNDDVSFYSYIYKKLVTDNHIDSNVPLVFIPASTKDNSGGKEVVRNWVKKLQDSGLVNIVQGLIDADSDNVVSDGIYKINRYSIENYLADPILVYAALMDKEKNPLIEGIKLSLGEEYKLKSMPSETLQKVADSIFELVEPKLKDYFPDFNHGTDTQRIEVIFVDGTTLLYPKWVVSKKGKTILNELYDNIFTKQNVNFSILLKALKKLNKFPKELVDKFTDMKTGVTNIASKTEVEQVQLNNN